MDGLEHKMAAGVNQRRLATGISAPENEHQMVAVGRQGTYGGIGELLPSVALMACSLMRPDGQRGVEQKHALLSPSGEVARCRDGSACVIVYLAEYVDQRGRRLNAVTNGEAQAVGLAGLMIWVLTNDDNLDTVERAQIEGVENQRSRRIARAAPVFVTHKIGEFLEIWLLKLAADMLPPRFFYFYVHIFFGFLMIVAK